MYVIIVEAVKKKEKKAPFHPLSFLLMVFPK